VVSEPHRRGPVVGGFLIGAPDPAVPVVGGHSGHIAVTEPDAGHPLPRRIEPADLVQLRGADLAASRPNIPPASTAPSCRESPVAVIRAPACRAASPIMARSAVLSWLASSSTSTSSWCSGTGLRSLSVPSFLPRNSAML